MTNERLVRNAALPPKRHVSVETTYALERIACVCGDVITGAPDPIPDRHGPLIEAWQAHLRAAGVLRGSRNRPLLVAG